MTFAKQTVQTHAAPYLILRTSSCTECCYTVHVRLNSAGLGNEVQIAPVLTAIGFSSFAALYSYTRRVLFCSPRSANAIVSGVHAVVMVFAGALSVMRDDYWKSIGQPTSKTVGFILAFSLGYFMYDLITCFWIDLERGQFNVANLVHHLLAIVGVFRTVWTQHSGTEVLVSIFYSELSTPFLHSRTLLKEQGTKQGQIVLITEVFFAATFTIFRVLVCPFLTYETLVAPGGDPIVKATGLGLQIMSFYWFYIITRMMLRKFVKRHNKTP